MAFRSSDEGDASIPVPSVAFAGLQYIRAAAPHRPKSPPPLVWSHTHNTSPHMSQLSTAIRTRQSNPPFPPPPVPRVPSAPPAHHRRISTWQCNAQTICSRPLLLPHTANITTRSRLPIQHKVSNASPASRPSSTQWSGSMGLAGRGRGGCMHGSSGSLDLSFFSARGAGTEDGHVVPRAWGANGLAYVGG